MKDVDPLTKGHVRRGNVAKIADGNGITYHTLLRYTDRYDLSILRSDRQEHEQILATLGAFTALVVVTGNGLKIDAQAGAGKRNFNAILLADTDAVDQITVVKGDGEVSALMNDGNLIVGITGRGGCGDLQQIALKVQTDGRADGARDSLLGDQCGAFQCGDQLGLVQLCGYGVIFEDNAVILDVLTLDQTGSD